MLRLVRADGATLPSAMDVDDGDKGVVGVALAALALCLAAS